MEVKSESPEEQYSLAALICPLLFNDISHVRFVPKWLCTWMDISCIDGQTCTDFLDVFYWLLDNRVAMGQI